MLRLGSDQYGQLRSWLPPERAGPNPARHVMHTGHGSIVVDRWPRPRVAIAETGGNLSLTGDVGALSLADVRTFVRGFVEAAEPFEPLLRRVFPALFVWPRVILVQPGVAVTARTPERCEVRRLAAPDAPRVATLDAELTWISVTWGGAHGLAESGYAWGAFVDGALASVACSFFVSDGFEDVGIGTQAAVRGQGLAAACAARLCGDILARGRRPTWSTSPDNRESLRVAEKLGFQFERNDRLLVVSRV